MNEPANTGGAARVCVVGSLNMDLVVRCPRLPSPGETILGGSYRTFPGGKGANQAVAAAKMGARVSMVGRVGDDNHAPRLLATLREHNVDAAHVHTTPGAASGLGMITVADGGENTIVVASGANALVTVPDVEAARAVIANAEVLILQLEIPIASCIAAAKIAREAGASVLLNAAPVRQLPRDLLECVDVLVMNRAEAAGATGQDASTEPGRLALRAAELGPPTAIVTLGAQGSIIAHRGRPRRVSTLRVEAVDAVGAGDAFVGALAAGWPKAAAASKVRGNEELNVVWSVVARASVAGALAATRPGAIPSMPTAAEVEPRVNEIVAG